MYTFFSSLQPMGYHHHITIDQHQHHHHHHHELQSSLLSKLLTSSTFITLTFDSLPPALPTKYWDITAVRALGNRHFTLPNSHMIFIASTSL
mmetsp:Transcript_6569/g.12061  ORF Transcript_6569/g.12061 Transcript_6569/m.12061 type:complete len:92 (+) Transcript_6569:159-434(+)